MASVLDRADLNRLIDALIDDGYEVIGPTVDMGAIVYDRISTAADLPIGWTDLQDNATYRLTRRADDAVFGYALAAQSWKRFLFPPSELLWESERSADGALTITDVGAPARYAFLGMRACEIAAVRIQDRVFTGGTYQDPGYSHRRANTFFVGVNCTDPAGTCFCASMGTGPEITDGYDLVLTELLNGTHRFVVESGSEAGTNLMTRLPLTPATAGDLDSAGERLQTARFRIRREMDTTGIRDLLYANYEHPRWANVAERCLSCTNCTLVCPTCFCSTAEDMTSLDGSSVTRARRWDSCFTLDFSYVHGGSVRTSTRARYRQWLTHKLATWIDQFGTSGCVGCGRCITWCPAGIDITQELAEIRLSENGVANVR